MWTSQCFPKFQYEKRIPLLFIIDFAPCSRRITERDECVLLAATGQEREELIKANSTFV